METTKRLAILEASLAKKDAELDRRFEAHFGDVRAGNGQPMNDKRNGPATLARWEKQSAGIRNTQASIEKTKEAIEREKGKIANAASVELPPAILAAIERGDLTQWRRHPNTFFVAGVDRGRVVLLDDGKSIGHRYLQQIPADQYPKFRDVFNRLRAEFADLV